MPRIYIIFFILILVVLITLITNRKIEGFNNQEYNGEKNIWMYWENKPGVSSAPSYIDLCFETVKKNCSENCKIHILNDKNINKYLPNLRNDLDEKLNIPQKVDYYRYNLLYKYGGMWIDADTIVMNDLGPIFNKLKDYDYLGWGCQYKNCRNTGYPKPSIWFMVSRKNTELIRKCIRNCDNILDKTDSKGKINYFGIGRENLWKCIEEMKEQDPKWDYYHFDSLCFERDSNDNKYRNHRLISNEDIDKKCINKTYFVPIYNTAPGFPQWFKILSKTDILKSNFLISKLFRKALRIN